MALALAAFLGGACRRKATAPAASVKDAAAAACPDTAAVARLLGEPPAALRTACFAYPNAPYWMAAAARYDRKAAAAPPLMLLSGGAGTTSLVYDVVPAPTDTLRDLVARTEDLALSLRMSRMGRLVRLGITGVLPKSEGAPEPDTEEVALVFELVAHAPPRLAWWGPADRSARTAEGCISHTQVEFETLFGNAIEIYTSSRPRPGRSAATACPAGPASQESIPMKTIPLPQGRPTHGQRATER